MNLDSATHKIRRFFRKNKRLPSYQEMCHLFGFASKHASFKLAAKLIEAGILDKDDKGRLIPKQMFPSLPVLGVIRAGNPTSADEQILSSISFDDYLIARPEKSYLLRVSGDSMIEAGIHEGDIVIVEKDREPKEGDIVVRKTRKGRIFYGCSRYPDCKYASWTRPNDPQTGKSSPDGT